MNENRWPSDDAGEELTEEKLQEMIWNRYFPQMRFWICCNLFEILFLLAAPFLIFYSYKIRYPRWPDSLYHYNISQLFLFLIVLAISLAGMFYIFSAKDKSRLEMVKWLSLAGAFMMCVAFCLFVKEIGYASDYEEKLYWFILTCSLLHIVSCIRVFNAYKHL